MSEAPEIKIQAIIQLFSLIVNKGRYGMLTDKLLVAKMQKVRERGSAVGFCCDTIRPC